MNPAHGMSAMGDGRQAPLDMEIMNIDYSVGPGVGDRRTALAIIGLGLDRAAHFCSG